MIEKIRSLSIAIAIGSFLFAVPATAETPTQRAEALNNEGKALFKEGRYGDAIERFEQAILLSPDARFYFNLCFALNVLERYTDALQQCRLGRRNNPPPDLSPKLDRLTVELELRVPPEQRNLPPQTTGPASGDHPPPTGPAFVEQAERQNEYGWALGVELGTLHNLSVGKVGTTELYEKVGGQMRLFANIPFSGSSGLGLRPYIDMGKLGGGDTRIMLPGDSGIGEFPDLTILSFGTGMFWDINLGSSLVWSPFLGLHITSFQPSAGRRESLYAGGLRVDTSFAWLLGQFNQHVLSVSPSISLYGKADGGDQVAERFGLDAASSTFTIALGYTYRFDAGTGGRPGLSLE